MNSHQLPDPNPETIARFLNLRDSIGVRFHFYRALGKVVVVTADSTTLTNAIRFVRSASRESGWDVEVASQEDFDRRAAWFRRAVRDLDGVDDRLADRFVSEGFFSFDDLSIIDPDDLREFWQLTDEAVERIIEQAERRAEEMHHG